MPGGYMQLLYQGGQDIYLTGNPTMTFFNVVYRRHTSFGTEYITLPFDSIPTFTPTQMTKTSCKIDRNADLLHDTYLTYDLPAIYTNNQIPFGWVEEVGTRIIEEISIRLDGNLLDSQNGYFMKLFSDLQFHETKKKKWIKCVGGESYMLNTGQNLNDDINSQTLAINARRLYIPLLFWYCLNSGLALPLIALQYNELYIDCTFSPLNELIRIGNPLVSPKQLFGNYVNSDFNITIRDYFLSKGYDQNNVFYYFTQNNWKSNTNLLCNYIYLGDDERTSFAQRSHEYLITQVQYNFYQGLSSGTNYIETSFSHPVKELIWILTVDNLDETNDWYNFSGIQHKDSLAFYQSQLQYYNLQYTNEPLQSYINNNFSSFITNLKNESVNKLTNEQTQTYFGNYYSIMESFQPIFNNNDRMETQEHDFYENLQTFKYHSGNPSKGIYTLSFALNPEEHQPSGTQNFSRLNSQQMKINIFNTYPKQQNFNCYMYAINYNVLTIIGGIGSTTFSN